jgi:AraC-like DNA-binding protein
MKLNIKNMYSEHCLMRVKEVFVQLGFAYGAIQIGSAEVSATFSPDQFRRLHVALCDAGFELAEYNRLRLVAEIKEIIVEYLQYTTERINVNFSDHLSSRLQYDYTYLANVFSKEEGVTIERYIITRKIQHAMALIQTCELKLTEIAKMLRYSSVGHFSNQFKQISGLTPSAFRKNSSKRYVQELLK